KLDAERLAKHPVAYVDATFSAPKSLSIAYAAFSRAANEALAAGRYAEAAVWSQRVADVERAVMDGARAAVDFLQERAGYGRVGHHGKAADGTNCGRWIDSHSFIVGMFLQHDSRSGDPQLHVHCAILNRQLCADGQWRALDTRAIHRWRGGAAAVGERSMEASASLSVGLRWWGRPDGNGREVAGVTRDVIDAYSTRERALGGLAAQWQASWEIANGRAVPAKVRNDMRIAAALQSREKKSKTPPTAGEQAAKWGDTYAEKIGGELVGLAHDVIAAGQTHTPESVSWSVPDVIERTLTRLEAKQAMWSYSDVMRAVSSELPANLGGRVDRVKDVLCEAADAVWNASIALDDDEPTAGLPPEMLLADGRSSYQSPAGRMRTSAAILAAEQALREAVTAKGARALTVEQADAAVAHAMIGRTLGADQLGFIRGALTSNSQIVQLVAPAGTGKSYAIGALADAWTFSGGRVFGTATSQRATDVLREDGLNAMNIAQWLTGGEQLQSSDLVVVDESSMTSASQLRAVQQRCAAAGAKLVWAGDPEQLGAPGGSSLAHDLPKRGERYELAEVRRFAAEWEKAASLGLRQGDPRVLEAYAAHGRIIDGGTLEQAQNTLVRNYLADRAAGLDPVMIANSNEQAAQLSALTRAYLVDSGQVSDQGVPIGDGNIAGVGDVIEARANNWRL
ncbi:MAG: AAA family ATPase, partial [Pseudonocardiales bacterium]|nr:AAA family ATPase [Pseudonocardiales bacterium]